MRIDSPLMTNSNASGSFTGSFVGDGSGLTGLATASYIEFNNVDGLTSFSSSIQSRVTDLESFSSSLDSALLTLSGSFSGSFVGDGSQLSGVTSYTDADTLTYINSIGVLSGSGQIASDISGSFTSLSQSVASDIADIIDGTQIVASASNALSASNILSSNVSGPLGFNSVLSASYSLTSSYNENPVVSGSISGPDWIDFTVGATVPYAEGRLFYDDSQGALAFYNEEADITLQIGQEFYKRAYNASGVRIDNGTPVRVSGSQGDVPYIWPAYSEDIYSGSYDGQENRIIGIATHHIEASTVGYVTEKGVVRGINTSMYDAGDTLYLQTGSAGFRNTPPPFPYEVIKVGNVVRSHSNGFIEVDTLRPITVDSVSGIMNIQTEVLNDETFTLQKGTPVHATAEGNGPVPRVKVAMANDPALMPATFVTTEDIPSGSQGTALAIGYIYGVDTSGFTVGDVVYVGPNGGYTNQKPTGSNEFIQNLGVVLKSHATEGSGFMYGAGRSNDVPNLAGGKIWVGDEAGHFATSSIITLNETGGELQVTGSTTVTGNVTADTFIGTFQGAYSSSAQVDHDQTTNFVANEHINHSAVSMSAGDGLTGGGDITTSRTFAVDSTVARTNADNVFGGTQTFTDIIVNGTGSFAYITSVTGSSKIIGDAFVVVNNDTPSQRYAGLAVYDSGSAGTTGSLFFDGQLNDWNYEYTTGGGTDYGTVIFGPEYSTKGSPTYPTSHSIQKGTGGHHLADSNITDTGTLITLGSDTDVNGTLDATNLAIGGTTLDQDIATLSVPASTTISTFGATLVDDASAIAALTTLGGTATGQAVLTGSNAAAIRATINVDVAGTDNSTDVTLAGNTYLTISGQQITAGTVDISSHTNLAAGTGLTLTGDTIAIDSSVLTTADEGSGNGLDADTLDGQHGSYYLDTSGTAQTKSGNLTINGNLYLGDQMRIGDDAWIEDFNVANAIKIKGNQNNANGYIAFGSQNDLLGRAGTGALTWAGSTIWHAGNDGAGSGLDADTVDSLQASQFLRSDTSDTMSGVLTIQSSNDNQLLLQSTDTWAGIGFDDTNSSPDYIWYHGGNQTFAIGGGGANVSGKKLHVDGGMSVGSSADSVAMPSNGLYVEGAVSIGTTSNSAVLDVAGSTAGQTVLEITGTSGQLFSVVDDLTGDIFNVSDATGVPILTVNAAGTVLIDDTLNVTGDITAYYSSDERLKDNIVEISDANEKILKLRGVEFDWNNNSKNEGHDVGVIAQDVEAVLPELVTTRENTGFKAVKYDKIVALLIQSNKELIKQNEDLVSRIEALESKIK